MAGVDVLRSLFDDKKIRVLQTFIQKPTEEFTLQDIVKKAKVPLATTHRILKSLTEKGLLTKQKIRHLTLYQYAKTEQTQYLSGLLYEKAAPISKFIEIISSVPGISQVIMHGKESESRANIVIIGTGINKQTIDAAVVQLRQEDHYTITHLILEPEQFSMLESMGQFSGRRTILLEN